MDTFLGILMGVIIACCIAGSFGLALWIVRRYACTPGWRGDFSLAGAVLTMFLTAWTSIVVVVYTFWRIAPQIFNH